MHPEIHLPSSRRRRSSSDSLAGALVGSARTPVSKRASGDVWWSLLRFLRRDARSCLGFFSRWFPLAGTALSSTGRGFPHCAAESEPPRRLRQAAGRKAGMCLRRGRPVRGALNRHAVECTCPKAASVARSCVPCRRTAANHSAAAAPMARQWSREIAVGEQTRGTGFGHGHTAAGTPCKPCPPPTTSRGALCLWATTTQ